MSQREGMVRCGVCRKSTPAAFADRHHVTPQSVGLFPDDREDNLIWICHGCHGHLHIVAGMIASGKSAKASELVESFYEDHGAIRRIIELAQHVAREMVAAREGERELPAMVVVSAEVPREIFTALKLLSLERRGPRQFAPFLVDLLTQTVAKVNGREGENLPEATVKNFS